MFNISKIWLLNTFKNKFKIWIIPILFISIIIISIYLVIIQRNYSDNYPSLQSAVQFHRTLKKPSKICSGHKVLIGLKFVCLKPGLSILENDCIVLSFGINNEWKFDDGIANKTSCMVIDITQ